MFVAVDFDGTIVDHRYPDLGMAVPGAFEWLAKWQESGAKLILLTMRHDESGDGPVLTDAVELCRRNGIEFYAINENPSQKSWTQSPKVYAHIYVDDAALGCPLRENTRRNGGRPFVDWEKAGPIVLTAILEQLKRGG